MIKCISWWHSCVFCSIVTRLIVSFVSLQWDVVPLPVFLIIRVIEAAAMIAGTLYGIYMSIQHDVGFGQFVYLTIWTYYAVTVFHIASAVCSLMGYLQQRRKVRSLGKISLSHQLAILQIVIKSITECHPRALITSLKSPHTIF